MEFTKQDLNKTLWVKKDFLEKNRVRYKTDATGKTLGRLAAEIANKLTGKNNVYYNDFWDAGDYVIVENADKIIVTGNKLDDKNYYSYSGYKGNLKTITLVTAVRGMIPRNKLRDGRMKRLKVVLGSTAQYDNFKPISF